ncbi:MAG: sulfur carrier protein ThiS [Verrucomicrobiales bacterium]
MQITLNGQPHRADRGPQTISEFVSTLETGKQPVLVELNGEAILKREFDERRIEDGDVVEVIRMVAGG